MPIVQQDASLLVTKQALTISVPSDVPVQAAIQKVHLIRTSADGQERVLTMAATHLRVKRVMNSLKHVRQCSS